MRILVIGGGGREHAIAWKCRQNQRVSALFVAPGNAGTAAIAENVPIGAKDIAALVGWAKEHAIDLTIVGPDDPLALGIVDAFQAQGLRIFGPTQAAARLEWSKAWAKEFMRRHGLPTAPFQVFENAEAAKDYLRTTPTPIVVKADGLALGKGTFVCRTRAEALAAVHTIMEERAFGAAGERVVIEECLSGREVSVFAFCDGTQITPLATACDYKRAFDNDEGPNTGGMGGYSPAPFVDPETLEFLHSHVMERTIQGMAKEGHPYVGVLYAGIILTRTGPQLLEFNARLGDPEAQLILPRLQADLVEVCLAAIEGRLDQVDVTWSPAATCGVVLASKGYPDSYPTGFPITGTDDVDNDTLVFHAGTKQQDGSIVTAGGRVLIVVGQGANVRAYANVPRISFPGMFYRTDIAKREV